MAETMKLQIVKCPACNQALTSFSAFKSTVTCPRCGSVIKNPLVTAKEEVRPERYIPFSTQEGDFERSMVNALIEQDYVPKNIFEAINTDNVFRAYLPMYLYEGSYQAAWSCESSYMEQQVKIKDNWTDSGKTLSTKDVKKWRPQNGNAAGNFAFLCVANEGTEDLPQELREFTYQFPYDVMQSKEFDGDLLKEEDERLITIPRNADSALVWQKHGKDLVDSTAQNAALNQIGDQEIRKFRASSSFNLTTKGEYILAPFWFVYYTYNNQRYNYMMDGTGQRHSYNYPVDDAEVAFVNGKEKIKKIVKWLWLLFFLLLFIAPIEVSIGYLVAWFIGKIIVNKVMDKQIREHLDESKAARRASAARLGII